MKVNLLGGTAIRQSVQLGGEVTAAVEGVITELEQGRATAQPIIGIEVPERRGS